jgi:hypothetical protein
MVCVCQSPFAGQKSVYTLPLNKVIELLIHDIKAKAPERIYVPLATPYL